MKPCYRCGKHPRHRKQSYCIECLRERFRHNNNDRSGDHSLHKMADNFRPKRNA